MSRSYHVLLDDNDVELQHRSVNQRLRFQRASNVKRYTLDELLAYCRANSLQLALNASYKHEKTECLRADYEHDLCDRSRFCQV
jgi:hypothetical protein